MNYSKISGQNVCKMAMFFAFMLAACSEDNSLMNEAHGGSTEETNVYALAGRVGDVYPKVMRLQGLDLSSQNGEGHSDVNQGTVVVVSELDSLTLEKTGRSFVCNFNHVDGLGIYAVICFDKASVQAFAQVVNAEVFAVVEYHYLAATLIIDVGAFQ